MDEQRRDLVLDGFRCTALEGEDVGPIKNSLMVAAKHLDKTLNESPEIPDVFGDYVTAQQDALLELATDNCIQGA